MRIKKLLIATVMAAAVFSCTQYGVTSTDVEFSIDVTELNAPAEFQNGTDSVRVVTVRSNRSWTAFFTEGSWARTDFSEHRNLSGLTEDVNLCVFFKRNLTSSPKNGVLDFYCDGRKISSIPVEQEGAVFHLKAEADKSSLDSEEAVVTIPVDCNTDWSVAIKEGSTITGVLDKQSGFDADTVRFFIEANEEKEVKTSTLVFSARECPDVEVKITQAESDIELKALNFESNLTKVGEIPSKVELYLKLNCEKTDPEAVGNGLKFYYTIGNAGFDKLADPTTLDNEFPSDGIKIERSGAFDDLYVKILGKASGFYKKILNVRVRTWSFYYMGAQNATFTDHGLTVSGVTLKPDESSAGTVYPYSGTNGNGTLTFDACVNGSGMIAFKGHNHDSGAATVFTFYRNSTSLGRSVQSTKGLNNTFTAIVSADEIASGDQMKLSWITTSKTYFPYIGFISFLEQY